MRLPEQAAVQLSMYPKNGDDSAAGDESAPLKTISAAFTKAADGDTICLLSDIVFAE